jgi:SAM-dependent methyltransferase
MKHADDHITLRVQNILHLCGAGRYGVAGERAAGHVAGLRARNMPAEEIRFPDGVSFDTPEAASEAPYDTLLLLRTLDGLDAPDVARHAEELYRRCRRYLCLLADLTACGPDEALHDISWWERIFLAAGFRIHPRSFLHASYPQREAPPSPFLLAFEKIPEPALDAYPLESFAEERLLHTDMLRESGRRSDAHTVRYFMAARYIRPGDAVLDCACGLGYGAHILYQNSRAARVMGIDDSAFAVTYAQSLYGLPGSIEFSLGDAQNLRRLPDNSADFITAFETIEHLPDPERYLAELFRILRPAGRIMLSAPDRWVDESGRDPNPHHLHVYSWERLYAEVNDRFLPEKGFIQIAGGAMKIPGGPRVWEEIPCRRLPPEKEAEWVLLLAMKDPLLGRTVPYVETTFPLSDDPDWHVGAFGKDYCNPWLLKGMISMGYRLENRELLEDLQQRVLAEYPPDCVDYGAALCGQAYSLLEQNDTPPARLEELTARAEEYAACGNHNPHVLRWKVSLLYAVALLHRAVGDHKKAEAFFLRCAAYDVLPYSALLGAKTVDALCNAAILAVVQGKRDEAEGSLKKAMQEASRLAQGAWLNIIHDVDRPFEPGFPEMAQLMDKASRACYMLGELRTAALRPGLAFSVGRGLYEGSMEDYTRYITELQYAIEFMVDSMEHMKNEVIKVKHDIALYEASKSWKITAPLRKLATLWRNVTNSGQQ